MKNFFFSKLAIILLIFIYAATAILSGCIEYLNGASLKAVLFLRGGTILLDAVIIGLGLYTFTRKWLNKRFLEREFFRKRLFWLAYIAETLAIFLLFYVPYVGRSFYLVLEGETIGMPLSVKAFMVNIILGFLFMIVLGAKMKQILGKLEKKTEQNGFEKKEPKPSDGTLPLPGRLYKIVSKVGFSLFIQGIIMSTGFRCPREKRIFEECYEARYFLYEVQEGDQTQRYK